MSALIKFLSAKIASDTVDNIPPCHTFKSESEAKSATFSAAEKFGRSASYFDDGAATDYFVFEYEPGVWVGAINASDVMKRPNIVQWGLILPIGFMLY